MSALENCCKGSCYEDRELSGKEDCMMGINNIRRGGYRSRDLTIDLIKGIGIILMVIRHARAPYSDFVLLFHMAIFFIASGYLYRKEQITDISSLGKYIWRKIKGLYKPYWVFNVIFVLCNNLFLYINVYTDNAEILTAYGIESGTQVLGNVYSLPDTLFMLVKTCVFLGFTEMGGAFWFFQTLFIASVGYALMDFVICFANGRFLKFTINRNIIQAAAAVSLLGTGYLWYCFDIPVSSIGRACTVYCLLYVGNMIKQFRVMEKIFCYKDKAEQLSVFRTAVIILMSFMILLAAYPNGTIGLSANKIENPAFFLIASISGWMMLYGVALLLQRLSFVGNKAIAYISIHSVPIIALHFLCFKIINAVVVIVTEQKKYMTAAFPVLMHTDAWWIAYAAVGIGIPLLLDWMVRKIRSLAFSDLG